MSHPFRKSELVLVSTFLVLIASVPLGQTCLQWLRHETVQATDVFHVKPTARNLRQFERTLEEKSWFQQSAQRELRQILFATLKDTGTKGVLGRDGWLFYRPDVRYLVEPDHPESDSGTSRWVDAANTNTAMEGVERAILRFRDQLHERGITLVVMPVPGKPAIYPDRLTRRLAADPSAVRSPTLTLLAKLERGGVATLNLFEVFQSARADSQRASVSSAPALYLARDTHWTPLGARWAAEAMATRLRVLGFSPEPTRKYTVETVPVDRWGDVLEMMQIPGLRDQFTPESVECHQVIDPSFGPLVPAPSERPGTFRVPGQNTPVLVLGDSFCRIYQFAEPQSLGQMSKAPSANTAGATLTRRLLPGSAGFISQLALALQTPVDAIVSDGGAGTDVRRKLSMNPEILEGKKVVVWEFVEREIALGRAGWEDVPLPPKLD